jgi:hypothetical protein
VPVEVAAAGHGTLASDVEGGERAELPGIGLARDHPILLLHGGVRGGRLHAAEFERRPFVLVEIGQDRRSLGGLGRVAQRRRRAHHAGRRWDRSAVLGDEQTADSVIGPRPVYIMLNNRDTGRLSRFDRLLQLVDGRLFEHKRLILGPDFFGHDLDSDNRGNPCSMIVCGQGYRGKEPVIEA